MGWLLTVAAFVELCAIGLVLAHGTTVELLWLPVAGALAVAATGVARIVRRPRREVVLDRKGIAVREARRADPDLTPWADVERLDVQDRWARTIVRVRRATGPDLCLDADQLGMHAWALRNLLEGWRCAALAQPYVRIEMQPWGCRRTVRRVAIAITAAIAVGAAAAPLGLMGYVVGMVAAIAACAGLPEAVADGGDFDEVLDGVMMLPEDRIPWRGNVAMLTLVGIGALVTYATQALLQVS